MKKIDYKIFSAYTHEKIRSIGRPSVCQFELTFKCSLNCSYCCVAGYNKPENIKKELDTARVLKALDALHALGILWLCFTGGDPLERADFREIYSYAKGKGFLITLFTTGYSMTRSIADFLARNPPFVIEITINSVDQETYEKISRVKGSYKRSMQGFELIREKQLPLKVKTMGLRQNYHTLAATKRFFEKRGIRFRFDPVIFARLDGDTAPCNSRLTPEEIADICGLFGRKSSAIGSPDTCDGKSDTIIASSNLLFQCALGRGTSVNLDPSGRMFICNCIRKPSVSFLASSPNNIRQALFKVFPGIARAEFATASQCRDCDVRNMCFWCPGKALLETGNREAPIRYFCELAHVFREMATARRTNS
jgi:radical SAM protein with 4Fe4S-binding SPASM domain